MDGYSDLSDGRTGRIDYMSASPFEIHHILCKLDSTPKHPMFGWLLMPDEGDSGTVPCVVAIHGSRGWRPHHEEHISNWLEAGIAVFRVHCFDSRQVNEIVEDQMMVTHAMMLCDAFGALKLLSTHPLIDPERIAVTGWSLGGTVALYSAWSPIAEALAPDGERFSAHLPFYPAAHMRPEEQRWSDSPIQVLHGEDDDYTPLELVVGLADEANANIEVKSYPKAHHAFDSQEEMTWLPNAISLDSRTIRIDLDGDMWAEVTPGQVTLLNGPLQRLASLQFASIGAHVGGEPEARALSQVDSTEFLRGTLGI
uniref:Alpha/beta hydrolase fold containing protein n=1 Tax=uncultured marine group II/III euryarchaeote KM3_157_F12 TaxID=1457905 RepID=A0A075GKY0_9EURY|nr:alpha/beta hydrolase fold containing protein [uncultured marine group II/III euryarchaeote KM3_157_F12]